MKRLIALLITLVLIVIPVSAESGSYFDYTDSIQEDGTLLYTFEELSLQLPASWKGKVMAEKEGSGANFYQISSYKKYLEEGISNGGFLFRLGASVNQSFTQLPKFKYIGFSEESCMNYYLQLPTDYPAYYDKDIKAEYDEMYAQIDYVVENAKFLKSGNEKASTGFSSGNPNEAGESDSNDIDIVPGSAAEAAEEASEAGITNGSPGSDAVADADAAPAAGAIAEGEEGEKSWTQQDIRYFFEHSTLPQSFYDRPYDLLIGIYKSGIYSFWKAVCEMNGVTSTYPEEDYIVHWYTDGDKVEFVQIEFPTPDASTLCYRVYLIYDDASKKCQYYTVEYDPFSGDYAFLGTWSEDREHKILGAIKVLESKGDGYKEALENEKNNIAEYAGITGELKLDTNAVSVSTSTGSGGTGGGEDTTPPAGGGTDDDAANLQVIECPQQGFVTKADKSYAWDYEAGTGISIYTEYEESIPYVIVYHSEDLLGEPFEYIKEQYTPYMKQQYGSDLISYEEREDFEIGGKTLPVGHYLYKLGDYEIEMIRIYDSTGKRTVTYTAKFVKDHGEDTLKALDTAIRNFQATSDSGSF